MTIISISAITSRLSHIIYVCSQPRNFSFYEYIARIFYLNFCCLNVTVCLYFLTVSFTSTANLYFHVFLKKFFYPQISRPMHLKCFVIVITFLDNSIMHAYYISSVVYVINILQNKKREQQNCSGQCKAAQYQLQTWRKARVYTRSREDWNRYRPIE